MREVGTHFQDEGQERRCVKEGVLGKGGKRNGGRVVLAGWVRRRAGLIVVGLFFC